MIRSTARAPSANQRMGGPPQSMTRRCTGDKDFSFTDCTSFVLMREMRLTQALTTDSHFRQMGFQVVPAARGRAKVRSSHGRS